MIIMATSLVSSSCYRHEYNLADQVRRRKDHGFYHCVSNMKVLKSGSSLSDFSRSNRLAFVAQVRQSESDKFRTNDLSTRVASSIGQETSIVPTKHLMRSDPTLLINGASTRELLTPKHSKAAVNDVRIVKMNNSTAFMSTLTSSEYERISFKEGLKVLPSDEGFSWAMENYSSWQRTTDFLYFLISLHFRVLFDNAKWTFPKGFTEEKQKLRRQRTASWLKEQFLQLGPCYIKIGQLSSTMSDLFPTEFVDELAKLQDRVPAFSPEKARSFIQSELGFQVDKLFKDFEDHPIAAASLGQVHRTILHNGEKVIVKIHRPGLGKLFDIDLKNLKLVAQYFQWSKTFGGFTKDWLSVYDECSKILYQEIDYINGGKNADKFRRDFRNIK